MPALSSHELAEQRPEQEQWKELRQEARRAAHEGLGPVREEGLARYTCGNESRHRREQEHAPAAIGEPGRRRGEHRDRSDAATHSNEVARDRSPR